MLHEIDPDVPLIETVKYAEKTECYCGISYYGITGPVWLDSPATINSDVYTTDIVPGLVEPIYTRKEKTDNPLTTKMFRGLNNWHFQQDLASAHRSSQTQKFLREYSKIHSFWDRDQSPPKFVEWPIEAFWNTLEARVYKNGPLQV